MKNIFVNILNTFLISLFILSCAEKKQNLQPKRTIIAGVVENMPEKVTALVINYCDPFSDQHQFVQDLSLPDGTFFAAHDYLLGQNITIRFDRSFINLYVNPGDSVFVKIDGNMLRHTPDRAVRFFGDNAEVNQQLFGWTNYAYQLPIPEFDNTAKPEEYISSIRQCFAMIQDSIETYLQKYEMNDFVKRWAFIDYKFVIANFLTDYEEKTGKWDVFTNLIFDIYNEDNFQSMYFQYHLGACINALISEDEQLMQLAKEERFVLLVRTVMNQLNERAPEGLVRDGMLYLFLQPILEENPEIYDSIPELQTVFLCPFFNEKLADNVMRCVGRQPEDVTVTDKVLNGVSYLQGDHVIALDEIKVLSYLVEKHKDKVIYIDVWATWCGPCLKEMEFVPDLHQYYAEKDVVFINLCLESNMNVWQQLINKHTIGGENYFLDTNSSLIFRAENNLSGFPSYMIIDKTGLVYTSVPRPSDIASVIQKIDALLE